MAVGLSISSTTLAVIVIVSPYETTPPVADVVTSVIVGTFVTVKLLVLVWPFALFSMPSNVAVNVNVPIGAFAVKVVVNVPSLSVVTSFMV